MFKNLTLAEFCEAALAKHSEQSDSVFMEWEVSLFGRLCGVVQSNNSEEAKRLIHKTAIRNVLVDNARSCEHSCTPEMPRLNVLAGYPDLQKEFNTILKNHIFENHFSTEELIHCGLEIGVAYCHVAVKWLDVLKVEVTQSDLCEEITKVLEQKGWVFNGIRFAERYYMEYVRPNGQAKRLAIHK